MKRVVFGLIVLGLLSGGLGSARADFINGNFGTGDLTGWTVFTTPDGTNGVDPVTSAPLPDVVSFDTTGSGATNSAHFNVGSDNFTQAGGGLAQTLTLGAGVYTVTGAFASQNDPDGQNSTDAGTFSVLVDDVVQQSFNLGSFVNPHDVIRGTWDVGVSLGAGLHTFSFVMTRAFLSVGPETPQEYLTNLQLSSSVPEPASMLLLGVGVGGLFGFRSLRNRGART